MIRGRLGGVVGKGSALRDDGIRRCRDAGGRREPLRLEDRGGLFDAPAGADDIDIVGESPPLVLDATITVGGGDEADGHHDAVAATVGQDRVSNGGLDGGAVGDVDRCRGGEPAVGDAGAGDTDAHAVLGIDGVEGLDGTLLVQVEA